MMINLFDDVEVSFRSENGKDKYAGSTAASKVLHLCHLRLAVRIVGKITAEKIEVARKAGKIVREEIEKSGSKEKLWQYFAVLTDTKSTGVKGDARALQLRGCG
jgi:hypothetical protein